MRFPGYTVAAVLGDGCAGILYVDEGVGEINIFRWRTAKTNVKSFGSDENGLKRIRAVILCWSWRDIPAPPGFKGWHGEYPCSYEAERGVFSRSGFIDRSRAGRSGPWAGNQSVASRCTGFGVGVGRPGPHALHCSA